MISEILGKTLVLIALTCVPIGITVGFLTDDRYKNPFVFILILFFAYIGIKIWKDLRKTKQKKK